MIFDLRFKRPRSHSDFGFFFFSPHRGWMYHFRENGSLCAILSNNSHKNDSSLLKRYLELSLKLHKAWQLVRPGICFHWKKPDGEFSTLPSRWERINYFALRKRTIVCAELCDSLGWVRGTSESRRLNQLQLCVGLSLFWTKMMCDVSEYSHNSQWKNTLTQRYLHQSPFGTGLVLQRDLLQFEIITQIVSDVNPIWIIHVYGAHLVKCEKKKQVCTMLWLLIRIFWARDSKVCAQIG